MEGLTTRILIGDDQNGEPVEIEQVIEELPDEDLLMDYRGPDTQPAVLAELRKRHLID